MASRARVTHLGEAHAAGQQMTGTRAVVMSPSERSRHERRLKDPKVRQTGVERWNLKVPVARHGRSKRASSQRQAAAHLHVDGYQPEGLVPSR